MDDILKNDAYLLYSVSKTGGMTIDQVKKMSLNSFFTLILGFEVEQKKLEKSNDRFRNPK